MVQVESKSAVTAIEKLSPRQREVLQLIARGLTNQEIGDVLGISGETVRTHVAALLIRLEVTNRTEAAAAHLEWEASVAGVARVLVRPAIAVLPVVPLGAGGRAATIAAGLTLDLVAQFSRWCWFPVIADVSTQDARALGATSQEIGERLGARFLVDAVLRSWGARWRLTASIADTGSGGCVWTETYDVPRAALFRMQDEVCQAIVAAAYPALVSRMHAGLPRGRTVEDLDAWELTHEALVHQGTREREANRLAQAAFAAALEREPTLLLAHFGSGLAAYDAVLNQWGSERSALDRLAACAERCTQLAPHMAEGYYLAGRHLQARGEHIRAIAPLTEAIGRNPSFAAAHALLGQVLLIGGRDDEGLERMRHACRLGPRSFVAGLASAHFLRGEYAEALATAESALATKPGYPYARALAAASAWWLDELPRATTHLQALLAAQPSFSPASFLRTFGIEVAGVARIAQALEAIAARRPVRA